MGAFDRLRRVFRDEYGAYLHPMPNARMTPGALIDAYWGAGFPVDTDPDLGPSSTYGWTWIDKGADDFPVTDPVSAGIFKGGLSDGFEISGKVALPQLGLSVDGSLASKYELTIDIREVTLRTLRKGPSFTKLRNALIALEDSNETYYRAVKDDFLVSDSFHVSSATINFESTTGASAEAEFKAAGMDVGAGVEFEWSRGGKELTFEGTLDVPIALAGRRVKRTCFLFWCGR